MRVAAIDIGTNTVLMLVAESRGDALRSIVERAAITRLGAGVDSQRGLRADACERTLACLEEYAREARELGVMRLAAVGTSALRDAHGADAFLKRAAGILGRPPRVIGGEEEARLMFSGALSGLTPQGTVCAFDVGGGSTEIATGSASGTVSSLTSAVSLNIGSVRLFERHLRTDPPSHAELQRVEADIAQALSSAPPFVPGATLLGVAGTVTQLAALHAGLPCDDGALVHGARLSRDDVAQLATRLASLTLEGRRALPGMAPGRADVLVVGSAIVRAVLQWSGAANLVVSDRGVRWGLAEELARLDRAPH